MRIDDRAQKANETIKPFKRKKNSLERTRDTLERELPKTKQK